MAETGERAAPLEPPQQFQFPFPPYSIQEEFMAALYRVLERGQLGIFESPTGTGKSLSLICGALTWFRDSEARDRARLHNLISDNTTNKEEEEEDWLAAAGRKQEHNQRRLEAKQDLDRLARREEKLAKIAKRRAGLQLDTEDRDECTELLREAKWMQKAVQRELSQGAGDEDILVEEYFSEEEDQQEEEAEEDEKMRRIFFCSRTHSQLTQFTREVQNSPFGRDVRLVSLASRAVMCVNPAVRALRSQAAINEKCLELGRKKTKRLEGEEPAAKRVRGGAAGGCSYNKPAATAALRDSALLQVRDIEELGAAGRKGRGCPYYAARAALPLAELVVLPYNTLLHAATRKAVGINLDNSIVIIDEAHNLLETITNIHSASLTGVQLGLAYSQLTQYKDRYSSRLKAKNILYIKQLLFILSNLIKLLGGRPGRDPAEATSTLKEESKMVGVAEFMAETQMYNLDLFKLIKYCNVSQICHKLGSFVEKYQPTTSCQQSHVKPVRSGLGSFLDKISSGDSGNGAQPVKKEGESENEAPVRVGGGGLAGLVDLLSCLSLPQAEARLVLTTAPALAAARLKFLLLDPAAQFRPVVEAAHSVVVAGGTMRPLEEFEQQLFLAAGASPARVSSFSCQHVVPPANLLPRVLCTGPAGTRLDFSYNSRELPATLSELGRCLLSLATTVPGGIVVFFPSYDYEALVFRHLESSGMAAKLQAKKKIFREPKTSGELDQVLSDYSSAVRLAGGALLLAVVGGKMSEGINFSDALGRAVVMVGLPYPSLKSTELQEKMRYLDRAVGSRDGRPAGQLYYDNLCMKAVNQSVGRAIRHRGDYAALLFLDHRYSRPQTVAQLPDWISKQLQVCQKFGPAVPQIIKFFKEKK